MTDETAPAPPPPEPSKLQFDRAESVEPGTAAACVGCKNPLTGAYFLAGSVKFCVACRDGVQTALTGGSRFGRFFRATVFGTVAAIIGAFVHHLFVKLTGWEIGLVAILMGLGVGVAVRNGSDGRGGWLYQGLAMLLTYGSIVGMFIPTIAEELQSIRKKQEYVQEEKAKEAASAAAPENTSSPGCVVGVVEAILLSVVTIGLAFAIPFLAGTENLIFLIIIGIALYEAWKINKRVRLEFQGPFQIGPPPPEKPAGG